MPPAPEKRKAFGSRLRALRAARSARVIADEMTARGHEVSTQAVGAWERGEYAPHDIATISVLEEVLGAEPDELARILGYLLPREARYQAAVGERVERGTYTVAEAAQRLGMGESTLYRLLEDEDCPIKHLRLGRRIFISRSVIERMLEEGMAS